MSKTMKIAFSMIGGEHWTGGLTYLNNLSWALRQCESQIKMYLLTDRDLDTTTYHKNFHVLRYDSTHHNSTRLFNKIIKHGLGYDFLLSRALRKLSDGKIDVVFQKNYSVGRQVARIYWIPDFQHLHLPEMFTADELRTRDREFRLGAKKATLVILSSEDAYKDFCDFIPTYAHKARVLNFVAHMPPRIYEIDPENIVLHYNLPGKFFYLPNQFWKHKNHAIVFESLKLLKESGIRPFIVCSGNPSDYRNPTYLAELMLKISVWGLREQIAFLGLIPHEHVYLLIRQSICVINPSLFEGWSTTVEETKSVGKSIILSNLGVHREQDPPSAIYFAPDRAEDLADKIGEVWVDKSPGPDFDLEERARRDLSERVKNYGRTFVSIAQEAIDIAVGSRSI